MPIQRRLLPRCDSPWIAGNRSTAMCQGTENSGYPNYPYNINMDKRLLRFSLVAFLLALLGLSFTGSVLAAEKYRVSAQVFHLGELIAQPVIEVEVGKTTGGQYSVPGESQYTFVVLVRPAAENMVFISLQFSSGKLNIQPNLLVDIDKQTSATIDKVRMVLLVSTSSHPRLVLEEGVMKP